MESSDDWFGEDFGQKIDLTVRIREILRNYPEGTSILKELVQNADDAGAREVRLCLDLRQHGTAGLPTPKLAEFQGPALLVYNDGVFTDTDFRSIQRIGDSLKKDTSKGGKTGRFGIGFNSVYHLTELPAFVSAGKWCSFDPQAKFLPNVNPSNPGKMVDFIKRQEVIRRYPDQFSPLNAFGCNLRSRYPATLFRFPLRTEKQAAVSRLSRQCHRVEDVRALLEAFAKESAGMLLFLKNVERMSVFEWQAGQGEPRQIHATFVPSPSAALRRSRAFALSATPEKLSGGGSTTADYVMDIVSQPSQGGGGPALREKWQVCNQLGGPRATAIAGSDKAKHMRLVPWAGVAARLSTNEASPPGAPAAPRGAAYCFLPLPVVTGLPVHVNGYFELSSNRRDIWHGDDMAGDGELRANWNKALVEELAATCYSRVLVAAKGALGGGDAYEALWPTGHTVAGSMWRGLADSLMRLVKPLPLLKTRLAVGGGWVAPQACVVWAAGGVGSEEGGSRGDDDEGEQRALAKVLLAEKVPLVEGGRELRKLLLSSGCAPHSSTPAFVRKLLKNFAARAPASSASGPAGRGGVGANGTASLRSGNPSARDNCLLLLHYCLADLGGGGGRGSRRIRVGARKNEAGGGFEELAGLPLVPLADGSHGVFRSFAVVDASKLEVMRGMGFSEARSRQALTKHKEVQAAIEWLSGGGGDKNGDAAARPFVLCAEEEARLLAGAGASLISEAALSKGTSPKNGASPGGSGAGGKGADTTLTDEDDGRVLRALRSPALQSSLNVTSMRDDLLPDLIGQTLPAPWRAGGSATAFAWTPGQAGHPDLEWFRRLWKYLASSRPSAVGLLAESFPVVPTAESAVCPLSLRSAVIDGGRIGDEVRSILVTAGCRTLLPGVFSGGVDDPAVSPAGHARGGKETEAAASVGEGSGSTAKRELPPPPRELFEYVRPGTRGGVLAALGTAQRSAGKPLQELMRAAGAGERDALREFLAREPASRMSDVEVTVCQSLPILPLHGDGLSAARALAKAPAASSSRPTNGSRAASGKGPSPPVPPDGSSYAAADVGPLYLLLEAGTGFIGVGRDDAASEAKGSTATVSPQWLEAHLLTPRFVKIGGSGAGRSGSAESALAERLGAKLISRAAFFVDHVFPRVRELPGGLRDAAMVEALLAAPRLSQQHQSFKLALSELEFVPTGDTLVRPQHVFDPEVPELPALLPESRFPDGVFRHSDVLAALRPLGLKGTLSWSGLVEAAASVESLLGTKGGATGEDRIAPREAAKVRGRALLTYLDTHEARLFNLKKEAGGLFQRMAKLVYADSAAEERDRERLAALHKLMALSWVPVLVPLPSPLVPATLENGGSKNVAPAEETIVVAPSRVRLRDDMWVSSRTFFVLDAEVRSAAVRGAFSWDSPIDPVVVARQVTALAETFTKVRKALEATPAATAAAGVAGGDGDIPSPQQNAHTLEGHRQTMAGVVPRLYQLLSNAIEAEDAQGQGTEGGAGRKMITDGVRVVLHEASWLWVGDAFVPADQVAFASPANAAPYLYAVPPDLACFATLLRRFGVRSSFGPSDFCHALRRLAVETGAADPPAVAVAAAAAKRDQSRKGSSGGVMGSLVALAGYGGSSKELEAGESKAVRVARKLSPAQVELAVAMVQVLSDESIRVSDLEVWVPDASSMLALSTDLLYDDAPWLTKQGHAPPALSKGKPARFVHPKVSMAVGDKVGVGSLRRSMVNQSLAQLDFGIAVPGESFGQQESLTRRLKHILQMYPEGPSILSELVQNADDAGARTVRVMLNTREYGDGSLLSPAMANWQGPSLYVYNDAVFTDRDFQNLARIGQASKLDKLAATGRFGLGFNAVYHFTDLPSFVSGEHLVMFDPHTKYVPGATSVQPGIKIRFAETDLLSQFPDQFSPYLFFGCELKNSFPGTLFRFPLRAAAIARNSEISQASYSAESVMALLNQFKGEANRYLLFLRHVQRIEMYTVNSTDTAPVLRYSVEVTKRDPPNGWLALPSFVSGPANRPLSKEAFYSKLGQTPDSAFPKVQQLVTITFREEAVRVNGGRGGGATPALTADSSSESEGENVDVGGSESESELVEITESTPVAASASKGATSIVDVFLMCAAIGGGEARKMACLPEHRHMKLIPWGGVAAHVTRNSQPPPSFEGHAFCFLPLPVNTLLPVHVNGFFELSSNRRDIWFGEDMAGEGKRRSEWNALLLRDVIAPIYASLVSKARQVMGSGPQHQALLPVAEMPKAWETLVAATYANLRNVPVLWSRTNSVDKGKWIAPGQAVVVEEEEDGGGGGGEEKVEYAKRLSKILLWDDLPVVRLPIPLKKAMLHYNCLAADATPLFLRSHFRRTDIAHPCLGLEAGGRQLPRAQKKTTHPSAGAGGGGIAPPVEASGPASQSDARSNALFLLQAASSGLKAEMFVELVGLPLLPLADGSLGRFLVPTAEAIFVCSSAERRLLAGAGLGGEGGGAGHRLLENLNDLSPKTRQLVTDKRVQAVTNVAVMEPSDLAGMLGSVFPEAWMGLTQVAWAPGSRDVRPKQPSENWVACLWDYICTSGRGGGGSSGDRGRREQKDPAETMRLFERAWPLLPATGGVGSDAIRVLLEVHSGMPVVSPLSDSMRARGMGDDMKKVLSQLGVWILDTGALGDQAKNPLVLEYANPCKPSGVLAALQQALFPSAPLPYPGDNVDRAATAPRSAGRDYGPGGNARRRVDNRFQSVGPAGRDALRHFLSDTRNTGVVTDDLLDLLKALPIFRVHGGRGGEGPAGAIFKSLSGGERLLLAPKSSDDALLGPEFAVETNLRDTELLENLGVQRVGKGAFFREHVLPKMVGRKLPVEASRAAILSVLSNLQDLCAEDRSLEAAIRSSQVVTNGSGEPKLISDLFDPAVDELPGLLGPEAFPAKDFCTPAALAGMRSLGLQSSLTCDGVLQSAHSIEKAFVVGLPPIAGFRAPPPQEIARIADAAAAAREAAVHRARKLLNFVDHRADQLLLASGLNGDWFVNPQVWALSNGIDKRNGVEGTDPVEPHLSVSSDSESEGALSDDTDEEDDEEREHRREARRERKREEWERQKERKGRQIARAKAAEAAQPPPPNDFVEQLKSIAWLPVHARAPNELLPWKGVPRGDSRHETARVAAPCFTRPESDQWFCSLRLGVLEGDVKSRSLKRAFGWDTPVHGLVLAVQLVSLSKKFEKLTVLSQKGEMTRKLVVVTQEIYNNLDLVVGSSQFPQVEAALHDREWLWVGDKFVSSSMVAFEVSAEAVGPLVQVPGELRCYRALLAALGVRKRFGPLDYVDVLRSVQEQSRGRPLDASNLRVAVAMVKTLAQLPLAERAMIKREVVLVPDKNGPVLVPASSLVYDDAPWLSSRLRQQSLRLVHPDIGDQAAEAVGVRSLRETLLTNQGGTQAMPCPKAHDVSALLNLSPGSARGPTAVGGEGGSHGANAVLGNRWLHDVMDVAEHVKAHTVEIILDELEHPQQSLLHPALADTQGTSVCVVLPGTVMSDKQITKLLAGPARPVGGDANQGMGRPMMGNGMMALFALTDCLQVLTGNSFFVFDPCGEYLFTGEKQAPARDAPKANPPATASTTAGARVHRPPSSPHSPSPSGSRASSRTSSPSAPLINASLTRRPRSAFSPSSSSSGKGAATPRTITGIGGANRSPGSGDGSAGYEGGAPRKDPLGRRYVVSREDVNQFPDQFSPFQSLPGKTGQDIREGLSSTNGFAGTVFRMSLRTRPGELSESSCTADAVERELMRFANPASAGLVMAHSLRKVHASVRKRGEDLAEVLFSSRSQRSRGCKQRHEAFSDDEWKKISLNVFRKAFTAPRGFYKVRVSTSRKIAQASAEEGRRDGDVQGAGGATVSGSGERRVALAGTVEEVEDQWIVSYVLAPTAARALAMRSEYEKENLIPLMTCSSLVGRSIIVDGQKSAQETPLIRGRLFVGQDTSVSTGLPFHIDGPFFVDRKGSKAFLIMDKTDNRASPRPRFLEVNASGWNKEMFGSICTELVPEHMVDLKNDLEGHDAAMLYRFWPSAKRAKEPFSIMLPAQMYQRLGDLPLYLSRSASEGGFKTMKEGYFKTQAVSPLVEEYIRTHVNLFSVPHTVTEDLARQPGVTVKKISPASVRQFLRRSKGDAARTAVVDFFSGGTGSAGSRAANAYQDPRAPGSGRSPPPDIDLLLELLEFCLSDCSPPQGERPPGVPLAAGGAGSAPAPAAGGGGGGGAGRAPAPPPAGGEAAGEVDEVDLEALARSSREANEARQAVARWEAALSNCKEMWKQLHGVQLLPLANGKAGIFGTSLAIGGGQRFIVATRRQQGLMRQLNGRFVHLKATRRLSKFFERDEFLQMMGIVRFSPAILAENLHLVLPRGWKGEKFVGWRGGAPAVPSAAGSGNGGAGEGGGNSPPKAGWLALFWKEVSLLDVATVPGLVQWPLVPITTGELVSCGMLQQVVRACPSMLNEVKKRGLTVSLASVQRTEAAADERDEKELQELLARQALEANPTGQDGIDENGQRWPDDEDDEDREESAEATAVAGAGNGHPSERDRESGASAAGNDLQSVEDSSPRTSSDYADAVDDGAAGPSARSQDVPSFHNPSGIASVNAPASSVAAGGGPAASGTRPPRIVGTPPRPPTPAAQPALIPPPPPRSRTRVEQRAVEQPRQAQGSAAGFGPAALAAVAGVVAAAVGLPQAAASPAAMGAGGGPVQEPPRLKGLVAVLRRLGVPVLELAFFPEEQRSSLVVSDPNEAARGALHATHALRNTLAPPYPISEACEARRQGASAAAAPAMADLIASGEDHGRDVRGRKLRLRWGALRPPDMDALVQGLSKPSDSGAPIAFPPSERDKLRDLPVWKTLSGKRVAVDCARHFSLSNGGDVADLPLPPGASDRLLAPSPEVSDLIRDIGVEQVTHSGVVARFVLPELGAVSAEDRKQLLQHVRSHWATLKQDQSLVDAFKEASFIPVKGMLSKANKLFDPRSEVLKEIFGDEPDAFPTGEFAEESWLDVLVDVGLRNKLDRQTILQCATKVESQQADPLPAAVANRASILMRHINSEAGGGELYNNEFLSKLARLRFVPVHLPPPAHRLEDDGIYVTEEGRDRADSGSGMGRDDAWSGGVVLMRFEEAAVPKDRNLVFTAFPVHMAGLMPNQLFWSLLKIQSPPPLDVVLRHVRILADRHRQLDRWRYPQTPVKVFQSLFEFLDENWAKLSPNVMKALKDTPLVPVGARLIKAGRLFFRLKENLSPFMFEVPRAFGAFDSLFKNLGTTQAPTASDYAIFLKELAGECGSQALNPNELGAVLKVLSLLAAELEADTAGELSTDIYVPDERSELVPWSLCLHNDSPSLAGRVDPSRLRCLHPRVSLEDCRRLHIPSVSQVVKEELELGFKPEPFAGDEKLQAQLSATLSSATIGLAVAVLVKKFSPEDASLGVGSAAGGGGRGGGGRGTFEARTQAAADRLKGFSVVFVKNIRSRFLRVSRRGARGGGEEDITAVNGATGSIFFVRKMNKVILVARGALPNSFPPSYAVAMAVNMLVKLPPAAVGPLSVLLATAPDGVEGCLSVLQVREGAVTGDELTRGSPGEPLTDGDKKLLELKPLKAFLPGEVIAWEDKKSSHASADSAATDSVMRYGIVIMGGSAEAGEGAGEDEDAASDGRGPVRIGEGLRHVRVKLTPGRVDTLLSTQVYSFRQARAGAKPSPGIAAHAAKVLRRMAGGETDENEGGAEESKTGGGGGGGARGGVGSVVSSDQLLNAVNDILGRADLSLSTEQGERLRESLKHKDEARKAQLELAKATIEAERMEKQLKKMDKAFVCSICCTNDVDTILATCGHMLCSSCMRSLVGQRRCPFCREQWRATAPFRRPGTEDVSDDEES